MVGKNKIIDLFSGVGGFSLGAVRAGFNLVGALEIDKIIISTHKLNFPQAKHLQVDISATNGEEILDNLSIQYGQIDGIIGGPPCQGFSVIGKQNIEDVRNTLFEHFFRIVAELKPRFFVAENVPGILSSKYYKIRENAKNKIIDDYDLADPILLKASDYGVPTSRERVFFIGFRKDLNKLNNLYEIQSLIKMEEPVYVKDALMGLPTSISPDWQTEDQGWQKIGKLPRSFFFDRLCGNIPHGIGHKPAIARINNNEVSGFLGTRHSDDIMKRYSSILPGKKDSISKSTRLKLDGFCPTIRAGTASDKGSFQAVRPIHPVEPRVIVPREAARLQGFPDWFVFHPTKWHSFRQIGNSVSPIVSEKIMLAISHFIEE